MDTSGMKRFRNQHYFETHGTDVFEKHNPRHVCVHQFQLDNRFLPVPMNVDIYGKSR